MEKKTRPTWCEVELPSEGNLLGVPSKSLTRTKKI